MEDVRTMLNYLSNVPLEKAFIARGQWWKDLMLTRNDWHVYFKTHEYIDENSTFAAIEYEQSKMMEIFDRLQCSKIKLDTSEEQWDQYTQEIIAFLGLGYKKIDNHPCDIKQYLGTYQWRNETKDDKWIINYDDVNKCLYTSLFWPYIPMKCIADDVCF
jgi:hypothetical protein